MKSIALLIGGILWTGCLWAQEGTAKKTRKDWSKVNIANRGKDHLMVQLGYNRWTNTPDSINLSGIPRTLNIYFLMDFPFKTDPRISVALGAGIGSDHQYFKDTYIDITGSKADLLSFNNVADTNHFKKYKMNTSYLEVPIELRFIKNPQNPNKSLKAAIGVKIGTLLAASTKGKNLLRSNGSLLNGYTLKEKSKRYLNGTRACITARVGYGVISAFASYQVNAFIKDGFGPDIRPMTVGITLSGL